MGRLKQWLKQKFIALVERAIAPWKAEVTARLEYEGGRIDGVISQEDKDARQAQQAAAGLDARVDAVAAGLEGRAHALEERAGSLEGHVSGLIGRAEGVEGRALALEERAEGLEKYVQHLTAVDETQAERIANVKAILQWSNNSSFQTELLATQRVQSTDNELFYHDFEERFRGPQALIAERQRQYLPLLRETLGGLSGARCVDAGCGRGEWLDLLREENAAYTGVDLNDLQLALCREKGHPVEQADAIAYLAALPEGSLDLVTAFQLIEHLPFEVLLNLFAASHRALRPGGAILFETPNNVNLQIGATYFYSDPTHNRPLLKDTVAFIAEHSGFGGVQVIESSPFDEADMLRAATDAAEDGRNVEILNGLLFGPQDYAVFGVKEAAGQTDADRGTEITDAQVATE